MGELMYAILSGKSGSEKLNVLFSRIKGISGGELSAINYHHISAFAGATNGVPVNTDR